MENTILIVTPVTLALVEAFKRSPLSSSLDGWYPFLSISIGMGVSFFFGEGLLFGFVAGLSASGLYSAGSPLFK